MSRQRDLGSLEPSNSSRRDPSALEGSAQRSFRIRKYSRSLSRSSRTSLHSARSNENDASPDVDKQLKTIEIDTIKPTVDINNVRQHNSQNANHHQFKSAALPGT
jgi:hypothetical protein